MKAISGMTGGAVFDSPTLRIAARLGSAVLIYLILDQVIKTVGRLPSSSYYESFILLQIPGRMIDLVAGNVVLFILGILGFGLAVLFRRRQLLELLKRLIREWSSAGDESRLRLFITVLTLLLVWQFSTSGYNFYVGRAHYVDRLFLVAFVPLVWWRPSFVLPFLVHVTAFIGQLELPLAGYSWATQSLPISFLTLFLAVLIIESAGAKQLTADFAFLAICAVAANYFASGLAKVNIGWFWADRVHLLLTNAHANGWLVGVSDGTISQIARLMSTFDIPMRIFTGVVEVGSLFVLATRRSVQWFIVGWVVLHAGIFAVSGICFWKWAVVEVLLYVLFFRARSRELPVFSTAHRVASFIIIAAGGFIFRPVTLAWHDSAITYAYRFEGVGVSGRSYSVPPSALEPYSYQFALSGFTYLNEEVRLPLAMGAIRNREAADRLAEATSLSDIQQVELSFGSVLHDPKQEARMGEFFSHFLSQTAKSEAPLSWVGLFSPPRDLWMFGRGTVYNRQEPLTQIRAREVTGWFDGEMYRETRDQIIAVFGPESSGGG